MRESRAFPGAAVLLLAAISMAGAATEFTVAAPRVAKSPDAAVSLPLPAGDVVIDYDVAPLLTRAATLLKPATGGPYSVLFWDFVARSTSSWALPDGFVPSSIAWHPKDNETFFVLGRQSSGAAILRCTSKQGAWSSSEIYRSTEPLRRIVVGPAPFDADGDTRYRLFFGVRLANDHYGVRTITELGRSPQQVFSPSAAPDADADAYNTLKADSALPVGFNAAGSVMLWQDASHLFHAALYGRANWKETRDLSAPGLRGGWVGLTPNGLGLLHWTPGRAGVSLFIGRTVSSATVAGDYTFSAPPSQTGDGRGVVGLVKDHGAERLAYVPIQVPLADVANAWMFVEGAQDLRLFQSESGLLRDLSRDQLFQLYDSELYGCGDYDAASPSRPYLVTTDSFWELWASAYEGVFIVNERLQAVPRFWEFVGEAESYFKTSKPDSPWRRIFLVLLSLKDPSLAGGQERARILAAEGSQSSSITGQTLDYSEFKPRGHYVLTDAQKAYFRAFRYLTSVELTPALVADLKTLPPLARQRAAQWIGAYRGFAAPPQDSAVWSGDKASVPDYVRHPKGRDAIFPLGWGFDNEALHSTTFHSDWPDSAQIKGPAGPRVTPSGLDLAAAFHSRLAQQLLTDSGELERYPPLAAALSDLGTRFSEYAKRLDVNASLYDRWLVALGQQWSEAVAPPLPNEGERLWRTKRLQTGLASWASLRHATLLINARSAAECGEAGFEAIRFDPPRGYVEPDPATFERIAGLFEEQARWIEKAWTTSPQGAIKSADRSSSVKQGVLRRLEESAGRARRFARMAQKELDGVSLSPDDYQEILYVGRAVEHNFLVFKSLAREDFGLSNPLPIPKVADVAGGGPGGVPILSAAVGRPMEWDQIVPFEGRRQVVKGVTYSYYEFTTPSPVTDAEWLERLPQEPHPAWVAPFVSSATLSCPARPIY